MEYVKGKPFFYDNAEKLKQYPYLDKNIKTNILIIGGGIDGAIANFFLSQKYDVALVDKSKIGFGCTSCATALLEYQLDEFADDLKKYLTQEQIVAIYKMGQESINKIKSFTQQYGNNCHFKLRPTFLYTDSKSSQKDIIKEYEFRKNAGFNVKLFEQESNPFPFPIKNGIFCEDGGCEFNPYLFTKQLIENSSNQDRIYENTKIDYFEMDGDHYNVMTNYGFKIECKKIIIATGFNWELLNKDDLCDRFVSFSIVTHPVKNLEYYKSALIHDVQSPYHYLRLLPDKRIIFGGEDIPWKNKKGIESADAEKKYAKLEVELKELFPDFANQISTSHKFCGAFGTTNNNLGLIGESEQQDVYYFISCGANGIINAMYGTTLLDDLFNGRSNPLAEVFSPLRKDK